LLLPRLRCGHLGALSGGGTDACRVRLLIEVCAFRVYAIPLVSDDEPRVLRSDLIDQVAVVLTHLHGLRRWAEAAVVLTHGLSELVERVAVLVVELLVCGVRVKLLVALELVTEELVWVLSIHGERKGPRSRSAENGPAVCPVLQLLPGGLRVTQTHLPLVVLDLHHVEQCTLLRRTHVIGCIAEALTGIGVDEVSPTVLRTEWENSQLLTPVSELMVLLGEVVRCDLNVWTSADGQSPVAVIQDQLKAGHRDDEGSLLIQPQRLVQPLTTQVLGYLNDHSPVRVLDEPALASHRVSHVSRCVDRVTVVVGHQTGASGSAVRLSHTCQDVRLVGDDPCPAVPRLLLRPEERTEVAHRVRHLGLMVHGEGKLLNVVKRTLAGVTL